MSSHGGDVLTVHRSVRAIMREMGASDAEPGVEDMLLDVWIGLTTQLANTSNGLRRALNQEVVNEKVAHAAIATVSRTSFEQPFAYDEIVAEAKAINARPLPLSMSPVLQLPPRHRRTTFPDFEVAIGAPPASTGAPSTAASAAGPESSSPPAAAPASSPRASDADSADGVIDVEDEAEEHEVDEAAEHIDDENDITSPPPDETAGPAIHDDSDEAAPQDLSTEAVSQGEGGGIAHEDGDEDVDMDHATS